MDIKYLIAILLILFHFDAQASNVHVGIKYSFKTAYSTIPVEEQQPVLELIDLIKKVKANNLLVSGHTDWIASDEINQELSEARAKTIRALTLQQIKNISIEIKGFGKKAPIGDNNTEEGRAANRRFVSSFIDVDNEQKDFIINYVEKSKYLYLIEVEHNKVEQEISNIQAKREETQVEVQKEIVTEIPVVKEKSEALSPKEESAPIDKKIEVQPKQEKALAKIKRQPLPSRYALGLTTYQSYLLGKDITGSGSGVNAEWVSKLNFGLHGSYQCKLSSNFWIGGFVSLDLQNYYDQSNPAFSWDKETPLISKFALVTDYETKNFGIGANLDLYEEIILKEDSFNLNFDKIFIYGFSFESKYYFLNNQKFNLGAGLDINLPLASSETFSSLDDLGYSLSLLFKTKAYTPKNKEWFLRVYYKMQSYSLENNTQENSYVGFDFSLRNLNWL